MSAVPSVPRGQKPSPAETRCQHCQKRRRLYPRGLCSRCYGTLAIRTRYPASQVRMRKVYPRGSLCRHCGKVRISRPRGLCWTCYYRPGVRDLYLSLARRGVRDSFSRRPLPTEPTRALPGTAAKIKVLAERAARGCTLWHPDDA